MRSQNVKSSEQTREPDIQTFVGEILARQGVLPGIYVTGSEW